MLSADTVRKFKQNNDNFKKNQKANRSYNEYMNAETLNADKYVMK